MKIFRNIFIGFIIIGVVLGVAAIAIYGFNFDKVYADMTQNENYELVEKEFDEAKDNIKLEFDNSAINVLVSEDGKYRLSYYKHTQTGVETPNYEGGNLHLKYREKWSFKYNIRPFTVTNSQFYKATLQVPAEFFGDITLKAGNGKITANNLKDINLLDINSNNGAIILSNIDAAAIKADCDNGKVELKNCTADGAVIIKNHNGEIELDACTVGGALSIDTNNGEIELDDCTVNGALNIDTNNGEIELNNCVFQTAEIENDNGKVELDSCKGTKVSVNSSNGSVKINSGEFDVVNIKNQNGNNTVSLKGSRGDYGVELKASNGKSYLNGEKFSGSDGNSDRAKSVYLKTSNGKNELRFI